MMQETPHDLENKAEKRLVCIQQQFKTAFAAFTVEKTSSADIRNPQSGHAPAQQALVDVVKSLIAEKAGPLVSKWIEESEVNEVIDAALQDAEAVSLKIGPLDAKANDELINTEFLELVDLVDWVVDANP